MASKYSDPIEIFKDLEEAAACFGAKSETFKELYQNNLEQLLPFQVPNEYEISYQGKLLSSHSLGQRASAMIIFILAQEDNDVLIVDQPEDDLDNQTVYDDVVKLIQAQKSKKQFLLATHNANFPVLGDAEMVVSCSEAEDEIEVLCDGIDAKNCQERIVRIMEGGEEAFQRRKIIYEQWQKK
ncbi:hypothetical protein [Sediminimonas sp.]|uniref:hypothetical protein n=1 Tax=Sediminimonas sp. TaxID=2823379 RepID=UPI0025EF456E|nr:hypothetical protein [Sediminimonas sp.]